MAKRPFSVTFVVLLTWISALLAIGGGLYAVIDPQGAAEGLADANVVRTEGFISIIIGLITAMVASALGRGSKFARFLVSLLMLLRIAGASIVGFTHFGTIFMWVALISAVVALIILWLLWNAKASAFFSNAKEPVAVVEE